MATKSILKNVNVTDAENGKALVIALETACGKPSKEVVLNRTYSDVRGEKIKEILGRPLK